jgi:vitamin B12 transporter
MLDSTDMAYHSRHDGGASFALEFQAHPAFLIIPSIKGVFDTSSVTPVPKLGLLWAPTDNLKLKNNYFRSFKLASFEDLYWPKQNLVEGNPDLKPEDGWGADIGGSFRFGETAELESTFFFEWTKDSIHWSEGEGNVFRPSNIGEAVYLGMDSKIAFDLPSPVKFLDKVKLSFSYQYLLSRLLSYGYGWESGKQIPYMPEHSAGFSVDLPWNGKNNKASGSILFSGRWQNFRYADTANLTKLEQPFLLDLTVNQKIGEYSTVFVAARNLFNKPYESYNEYYLPGLTVTIGIRMNIERIGVTK